MAAAPAGALSLVPPDHYNERYSYYYIDYNRDGNVELIVIGGEPGGYTYENPPYYKIYTYMDDEVKLFIPAEGSRQFWMYSGIPICYRNWFALQSKWIIKSGFEGWGSMTIEEVKFDFQSFQYQVVKTREFKMDRSFGYGIYYRIWNIFWRPARYSYYSEEGILTPERIKELLLNPPAN